uniref:Uncharacterized protein n=1 Tax=Sphaerodactylus townsendi TaxID=933632 RepID=A0ACB8EGN5_9SAUR
MIPPPPLMDQIIFVQVFVVVVVVVLCCSFFKKNTFPTPTPSVLLPLPISGSLKEKWGGGGKKKVVSKTFSPAAVNTLHDEFKVTLSKFISEVVINNESVKIIELLYKKNTLQGAKM